MRVASVLAVGLTLTVACSDDDPDAAPTDSSVTIAVPTTSTVADLPADSTTSTIDLTDDRLDVGVLPLPLDEDGALACANAQASLYRERNGDRSIAADQIATARSRAAASADRRFSSASDDLAVDLDDPGWETSVRAFLEICRSAGHRAL